MEHDCSVCPFNELPLCDSGKADIPQMMVAVLINKFGDEITEKLDLYISIWVAFASADEFAEAILKAANIMTEMVMKKLAGGVDVSAIQRENPLN